MPLLTTAEYRQKDNHVIQNVESIIHPLTGTARRYVMGDRFHTANNPHKSPLCEYHNINLWVQSNAIKTSYQESENNRTLNWLMAASKLHKHRGTCYTAEWPYCPFAIL